jgi:putative DNA primase/helicase
VSRVSSEEHEMDLQLEEKLSLELSGIFNWALEGYRKLKGKNFALRESGSMKLDKQEYRSNMDSVRAFVKDHLTHSSDPNDRLVFKDTYNWYIQYCQTEGKTDLRDKKEFKRILSDLGFKISSSTRHKNQVCIFNIRTLD